jgi:glutamyl-tRNA synthetase/nondiscriminating glutamyl-tRNA synthetase
MLDSKSIPKGTSAPAPLENRFSAPDVVEILRDRHWLTGEPSPEQSAWCARAAALLGPHSPDRASLAGLLSLIFCYDAQEILSTLDAQIVMSRYAARDVLRALANLLLDPAALTTEHFREIVEALKTQLDIRGRELFHPLRLALSGRSGEGELDRVVLLLDAAAAARFSVSVKTARARVIEFCSALD